jgi:hypothetical protein
MYLLQIIISQKTKKPILFENRLYFDPTPFHIAPSPLPSPQQKGRGEEEVKDDLILSKYHVMTMGTFIHLTTQRKKDKFLISLL